MATAIRTLVDAAPAAGNYTEDVLALRMRCPDGTEATYLADADRLPEVLSCGATYRVTLNGYGDITAMRITG